MDGFAELANVIDRHERDRIQTSNAVVTRIDSEGTIWVHYDGGVNETPLHGCNFSVRPGDVVPVTTNKGRAYASGNISDVPSSSSATQRAGDIALRAVSDAAAASVAAENAQSSANTAAQAAAAAQSSADDAATAAADAQTSADDAADAAANAWDRAGDAATAASVADGKAVAAGNAAAAAQADATRANTYSTAALDQLGVVQDVIGVLDYAAKHGAFSQTSDTEIEEGKVYFTRDSQTGDYVPVVNPQASALNTYFEMDYDDDKMGDFIMAHLAVTSRGLWVLPSGMGTATDGQNAPGYKVLLASDGMTVYDGAGIAVAAYGSSGIEYATGRNWHVGGQNAYISYNASAGTINIGGSNIQLGGTKTLSELMEQVDSTYRFEVGETYVYDESTPPKAVSVTLTPHLYLGDTEVTTGFPASCYTYGIKHETEVDPVPLNPGYGYSHSVSLSEAGYGATIVCKFSEPNDAELLTSDDDTLDDSDGNPLSVRVASGDHVRVSDLDVETTVFGSDRVMIVGSEDEHLVTIETLKDVFGDGDYERLDNRPSIEDVELIGNKTFPDLGIFKTDAQGYSVADQYTLTTLDINSLWANAQPIGG